MVLTSIIGLSPAYGPTAGGTTVSISGSGFTGATAVYFGTSRVANVDVVNDSLIYAYSPAGSAGVVDVTVTSPDGASPTTSADQYTYDAPPPASTSTYLSLSANPTTFGRALTLTATVSHSGYGPTPTGMVEFEDGTTILATEYLSGAAATFQTSTLAIGAHSLSAVYLGDTANAGSSSAPQSLTVNAAVVPAVSAVSPNSGPTAGGYSLVQISGSGFTGAGGVSFGGAGVGMFSVMNDDLIDVYGLPSHTAGVVDVTVTAPGGTSPANAGDHYTYVAPLTLTNPGSQTDLVGDSVVLPLNATGGSGNALTYGTANLPTGLTIDPGSGFITGTIAVGADGSYPYSVTVTASDGTENASQTFAWTVGHFAIPNPGDQTNATGDSVYVPTGGSDPDGDALTFTAANLPPGLSIESDNGLITGTISETATDGMPYAVTLTASDGAHSASQTFHWTVTHVFVVNPGDQQNADGDSVILPINAGDNDGDPVTYGVSGLPTGLSINAEGNIVGTISQNADTNSPYTVTVSATDGTYSASQTFQWTVSRFVLSNPGDQTNYDGDVVSLAVGADDNLGDTLAYAAAGLPTGLSINAGTGLISGTIDPAADAAGPYAVTVTATGGGSSDSQAFAWTVNNPVNISAVGDQTNALGDTVSLPVSATTATGDTLAYSAADLPDGLSINATTGLISGTIASTASLTTPYDVTVTASDGAVSANTYFVWTVSHLTLSNPGDQTNVSGDIVSLTLSASDNASADTLLFQANGLPPGLSINSSTGLISGTISLSGDSASPYTTTVSVSGGGYTAIQTFNWDVSRIAIVDPGDQNNADSDTVSLQIHAQDNNPNTLTYSAAGLPTGLSISSAGLISGTIAATADAGGPYTVTVTASDGLGHTAADTFFWSVTQLTLANPGDQQNAGGDAVALQLSAQGPDGVALTYSAAGLPAGLSFNASIGLISGSIDPAAASATPYTVTVTASDGLGASASQTFAWSVDDIYLADPGDQTYAADQAVTLPIVASDDGLSLTYSVTGLPTGLFLRAGQIMGTVAASAVSTSAYDVLLTAANALGNSVTVAFNINVADYTVKFSPGPVVTGYLVGADKKPMPLPNPVKVTATVSDATKAADIKLTPSGQADRIAITDEKLNATTGVITFTVNGQSATPADQPEGDTVIKAMDGTASKGSVNVIVVIPKAVQGKDHPQPSKVLFGENIVSTASSTPPTYGLGPNKALLQTVYNFDLTIQILDQFGKPLSGIYEGVPVSEPATIDNKVVIEPINQKLNANGAYIDPTGIAIHHEIVDVSTAAGKKAAADWPTQFKLLLSKDTMVDTSTEVYIGGFQLFPGIEKRMAIYTRKDDTVKIEWPDY